MAEQRRKIAEHPRVRMSVELNVMVMDTCNVHARLI